MPSHSNRCDGSTGRKTIPTPYSPAGGSVKPKLGAFAREKLVWDLDQDARAVAGFRIAAASAAMREVDEDLQALGDDVVRLVRLGY